MGNKIEIFHPESGGRTTTSPEKYEKVLSKNGWILADGEEDVTADEVNENSENSSEED